MLSEIIGMIIYAFLLISLVTWIPAVLQPVVDAVLCLLGRACWELKHRLWKPFIAFLKKRTH